MAKGAETAKCISIVVCETIYRDEETKNLVLAGTFNRLKADGLPTRCPRLSALVSLTNGRGAQKLVMRIEHAETGMIIVEAEGTAQFNDPLKIYDFNFQFQDLQFPAEGKYWFSVFANDEPLVERPFFVEVIRLKAEGEDNA
jgi:hypothetical protein